MRRIAQPHIYLPPATNIRLAFGCLGMWWQRWRSHSFLPSSDCALLFE